MQYFISDTVVVWRTWTIYYDNVYVRAYLAIVLLATGGKIILHLRLNSSTNFLFS